MRCSSCEPLLDRYLEGALSPSRARGIEGHLRGCAACASTLHELRGVDGLLATAPPVALPANFTFRVMADVRALPPNARPRSPVVPLLTFYVVAAWLAVGTAAALAAGPHLRLDAAATAILRALAVAAAPLAAVAHAFGPFAGVATSVVIVVLAADLALLAALLYFYRSLRPRIAALAERA